MRIIFRNDPTVAAKMGCTQQIKYLDILRVRELIIFHSLRKLFPFASLLVMQIKFIQLMITTKILILYRCAYYLFLHLFTVKFL